MRRYRKRADEHQNKRRNARNKVPSSQLPAPSTPPAPREGRSSPQEDLDPELLAGAGGLVDSLNLSVEPEAPLFRRL